MDLGKIGEAVKLANAIQRKIDFVRKQGVLPGFDPAPMIEALEAEKARVLSSAAIQATAEAVVAPSGGRKGA